MTRKTPLVRLFVPGNRKDQIEKAPKYKPDAIIIDLEDSVPIALKKRTRREISEMIPRLDIECLVRINSEPEHLEEDLKAIVSKHVYGVLLAKAETVELVQKVDKIITNLEKERNLPPDYIRLALSLESAKAVLKCFDMATAARRIETITCGIAEDGDLQRDLKCSWSSEGPELLYARSKVLLDGRAAGLRYMLDAVFSNFKDDDALRKDCIFSKRLGFDCRNSIHPRQLPIVRKVYSVGLEELDYYKRMIQAFEEAEARGLAAISFEGKLVDYAMYKKAKGIIS